jgi:hypothetical protein
MKVPKLLADIGGDIGPGDLGVEDVVCCEEDRRPEKRWGRPGDVTRGGLGRPCVDSGRLISADTAGTARVVMVAGVTRCV